MTGRSSDRYAGRGTPQIDAVRPCACDTQNARGCVADQRVGTPHACEFIDTLIVRYPRLFRGRSLPYPSFVPGPWQIAVLALFDNIDRLLDDIAAEAFVVSQIRSKHGRLRVYCWLDEAVALSISADGLRQLSERIRRIVASTEHAAPPIVSGVPPAPERPNAGSDGALVYAVRRWGKVVSQRQQPRTIRQAAF